MYAVTLVYPTLMRALGAEIDLRSQGADCYAICDDLAVRVILPDESNVRHDA